MAVLFGSMLGFGLTFALHMLAWRLVRPASPARLALACGAVTLPVTYAVTRIVYPDMSLPLTFEWLTLCGGVVLVYVLNMPVIESDSPSFLITMLVDARKPDGATATDLARVVTDERFCLHRLEALETEGLVRRREESCEITDAGRRFLRLFTLYHAWAARTGRGG